MAKGYYLGIDIGGSKISGVLLGGSKIFPAFNIKTPKNKESFFLSLAREINKAKSAQRIIGIGAGLPGIVDGQKGVLVNSPNIKFLNGWQAKKFFSIFHKSVRIDNDSRCFLRAEAALGAGRGHKNIAAITVGTGIGGGIMIGGKIYPGKNYGAGEFGHMVIDGRKSFEQMAAKRAFLRMGDRSAVVGIGAANLINALDPDIVILGGGGVSSGGVRIGTVKKTAKKYIMSPLSKNTPIAKGRLGDKAQAIGAALLFK